MTTVRFIRDIIAERNELGRPIISCEFFPPKTPKGDASLLGKTIPQLKALNPAYFSVTYGAGGSTRDKTLEIVDAIQREHGITAMAHLTCVGQTIEDIAGFLDEARERGIRNILALRGDPPAGETEFVKPEGGFEFTYQLIEFIRSRGDFAIGTAGFPEGHIACSEGSEVDWQRLKAKVDNGADFVITQLFFDNTDFFRFRDYLRGIGMERPILAGILPIRSGAQIRRFTKLCGAKLTPEINRRLDQLGEDDDAVHEFGVEYASEQCRELLEAGAEGIHFYTLNRPHATVQIVENLGLAEPAA